MSESLRPRDDLVMGVDADAPAFHSMRLASAVVDDEHCVVVGWHARQGHGDAGVPSAFAAKLFVFPVPSTGVNVTGFVSKWFSKRL